jgi:hypothetical protein
MEKSHFCWTTFRGAGQPDYTSVVGAGVNATTVKAGSGISGAVIQMGSDTTCSSGICFAVTVSDLTIDANGAHVAVDGIDNFNAEELSYAKRVSVINVGNSNIGLKLSTSSSTHGKSSHSGPYEDLSITVTSSSASCINILSPAQPRGIHGVTCTNSGTGTGTAGIYLDGSNVAIEDISFSGAFTNGIYVGSQGSGNSVYSNVLFNVQGGGVTNAVHISAQNAVTDLTIMGATNTSGNTTIRDDLPGGISLTDPSIGLYVVGESTISTIAYSRFTTSTSTSSTAAFPSWIVGGGTPSNTCGTGSLYSRIANVTATHTLWGCAGNTWRAIY